MTTPSPQPGAPAATYVSPIPVRRTHLGDALASEWTKIRSVRSTMWTLGVMILLLVGMGVLTAVIVTAASSSTEESMDGASILTLGFFGVLLSSMCVITLGVLTITSEFGTGMIRATLTACPSRPRVLTAKAIVYFLLVFVLSSVVTMVVAALQVAIVGDAGTAAPTAGEWFRATIGVSLFLALLGLVSLAVGTLIRHSAGSITVMIGVLLLPLVLSLFMFTDGLEGVRNALVEYSVPNLIGVFYDTAVTQSGPTGWDPLWVMLGVTAAAMAGAYASLNARDV
ncbi:ABC transporter permease [Streptomyces sp. CAU 1734]|uniref:ABC transporter permease n=1 Tax=Streptomyces sp. CAU 1734 TaxID=3140360 RepID=UPI0032612867